MLPAQRLQAPGAIVFGASSGIGRATARALAQGGVAVALASRDEKALRRLVQDIEADGGQAVAIATDVAVREQVDRAVSAALQRLGDVGLVVNSAGINIPNRRISQLGQADWDQIIATNLTGAFNTTQASLPPLRDRGTGLIVQVSSISGRVGDGSGPAYQASKAGILGLCQGVMYEERHNGIRISAVMPGLVDTPILKNRPVMPPPEELARALQPEDVAAACLFLASLPPRAYVPEIIVLPSRLPPEA